MDVQTFSGKNMKETIAQVRKSLGKDAIIISTHEDEYSHSNKVVIKATHVDQNKKTPTIAKKILHKDLHNTDKSIIQSMKSTHDQQNSYLRQMIGTMTDLKVLVSDALRHQTENQENIPYFLHDIHQKLLRSGLNSALLNQLCEHLSVVCDEQSPSEHILTESVRWMTSRIHIAPPIEATRGHQDIHLFVGPPGSGKSSMIARLAHHIQSSKNQKVAVISYEPKRLAASSNLQILSRILGFHYTALRHPDEVHRTIEKGKSFPIVLIDTSGFLPSDNSEFEDFQKLINIPQGIETHLVLSMLTKESILNDLVLKFSPLGISSLMFSRLDSGFTHADLFNLPVRWSCPLSYGSAGHELPEGLERMTREKVVEFIFGL
ncbi:MAG: hypothetical protein AB8C84_11350 [Oligoflexales bacterium]